MGESWALLPLEALVVVSIAGTERHPVGDVCPIPLPELRVNWGSAEARPGFIQGLEHLQVVGMARPQVWAAPGAGWAFLCVDTAAVTVSLYSGTPGLWGAKCFGHPPCR